jgi:hypothetical protein
MNFASSLLRGLAGLFVRPSLVASAVHAPVALVPGRVPVRLVARGTGVLRIGHVRLIVAGGLDDLLFVDVDALAPALDVRFRGRRVTLPLVGLPAPVPVVVDVVVPVVPDARVGMPAVAVDVPSFAIPLPDLVEENR